MLFLRFFLARQVSVNVVNRAVFNLMIALCSYNIGGYFGGILASRIGKMNLFLRLNQNGYRLIRSFMPCWEWGYWPNFTIRIKFYGDVDLWLSIFLY